MLFVLKIDFLSRGEADGLAVHHKPKLHAAVVYNLIVGNFRQIHGFEITHKLKIGHGNSVLIPGNAGENIIHKRPHVLRVQIIGMAHNLTQGQLLFCGEKPSTKSFSPGFRCKMPARQR